MTNKHRIALVTAFPPGARSLNEYGLHLATGLAERDDVEEVIILADILDQQQPELELSEKIRVRRCWDFNRMTTPLSLLRALRAERPDGVIYNLQMATFGDRELPVALGLMTPMLSRKLGIPSGIIAHNLVLGVDLENTILKGQRLRQKLIKRAAGAVTRAMTSASYITVTTRSYEDALRKMFPRADVSLVPHGTFDTQNRPWRPFDTRPERIVTMGKFGTYKKLDTLLAAFDQLRANPAFAEYQLHIGGSDHPNTKGYLDTLSKMRQDDQGVVFRGYLPEEGIAEFFEDARLSVFDYETTTGSSGVLHQTASYGAVPVFPRIGDFVDLCEDEGLRGFHYTPGDATEMAWAMQMALLDTDAADRLALDNRTASMGMPFSQVIDFHVQRIASLTGKRAQHTGPTIQKDSVSYTKSSSI